MMNDEYCGRDARAPRGVFILGGAQNAKAMTVYFQI